MSTVSKQFEISTEADGVRVNVKTNASVNVNVNVTRPILNKPVEMIEQRNPVIYSCSFCGASFKFSKKNGAIICPQCGSAWAESKKENLL